MLLILLSLLLPQKPYRLELRRGMVTVITPGQRTELESGPGIADHRPVIESLRLANGDVLKVDLGVGGKAVTYSGQSLDVDKVARSWMFSGHEELLGPGRTSNDMRYLNRGGIWLHAYLSQAIAVGDHVLGVLNWRWEKPNLFQHLVRIDTKPALRISPIRLLQPYGGVFPPREQKLFRVEGKLWLADKGRLELISNDGQRLGPSQKLPSWGLTNQLSPSYLIIHNDQRIWTYDLHHRRSRVLGTSAKGVRLLDWLPDGSELLVSLDHPGAKTTYGLVKVSTGLVRLVPTRPNFEPLRLTSNFIVGRAPMGAYVQDRKSLRIVAEVSEQVP